MRKCYNLESKRAEKIQEISNDPMQNDNRLCPVANEVISADICYEDYMCLSHGLKPESVPEVDFEDDEKTEQICEHCLYCQEWY